MIYTVSNVFLRLILNDIPKQAMKIYKEKNIGLVDCFLIGFAEGRGAEIFSFDQKLLKIR